MREKMTSVLHILRKDFRHVRILLGVWFLLALLGTGVLVFFLDSLSPGRHDDNALLALLVLIAAETMVLATIVSKLVHDDSMVGSTAFWLSRPISKGTLLASKMLFVGLAIVLPQKLVLLYATSHLTAGHTIFLPFPHDWQHIVLVLQRQELSICPAGGRLDAKPAKNVVARRNLGIGRGWRTHRRYMVRDGTRVLTLSCHNVTRAHGER